ncbi:MAG: FAD-dependent oxidoreductase [Deltaproteobacteria bacterium]|nr:FAD-dependent oxidoreductase [Deltaproteobacteria bacterium]
MKKLFSAIKIGAMAVKNRIVMAPMLTNLVELDGMVTDALIGYFEARAKGGAGMIITEVVTVDEVARYSSRKNLEAWDDKFIPGWRQAADAVHIHGAKLVPQLIHPGPIDQFHPTAPSAIPNFMTKITGLVPRELTFGEIEDVVDDFGQAARRLRESGCDGVEIHMAHGLFMAANFVSPLYNKRSDAYGGSFEARLRFPLEIIKNIKAEAGNDFPIIIRLSGEEGIPGSRTLEETQYMTRILVEAGVNAIDVSVGFVPDLAFRLVPPMGTPVACNASYSAALKEIVNVPVMAVGRINSPLIAEQVLETNKADLVVMGRALLADPQLPKKAEAGDLEDIAPCIACNYGCVSSVDRGDSISCTMNPTVGKEKAMEIVPAAKPKTVMVAGGGPGGLEAARVAALRGHQVTLFEKDDRLGGQLNVGAVPPFKQELCLANKYLSIQARKAGVRIELGKQVTPALIEEIKPDVVIVATGGGPLIPGDIQGIDRERVVTAWDVLAGKTVVAGNLVIVGGGMIGCETADFVADLAETPGGNHVTIVEMMEDVAQDMTAFQRTLLLARLRTKTVKIITSAEVKELLDDGVIVARNGQEEAIRGMDSMILAMGTRSVDDLSEKIKDSVSEVYVIGDAKAPRKVFEAISEGSAIGRRI